MSALSNASAPSRARPSGQDQPPLVVMSAQHGVVMSDQHGVVVIAPQDALGPRFADRLTDALATMPDLPIVIDLSHCPMTDPDSLAGILDPDRWGWLDGRLSVACPWLDGRTDLSLGGTDRRVALFKRVEDAIQAKLFSDDGYGIGWAVSPRRPAA